jgi:uncharacterized membrane protein
MKKTIFTLIMLLITTFLTAQDAKLNQRKELVINNDVVINISDITENALFYPVKIDDVIIEIIAVKAPDGTIRTAFNTCQVCYSSGKGYFVQNGTLLVCQNCGRRFRMSQVETESGGCIPMPITKENKTITEKQIIIKKEFIKEYKTFFEYTKK